MRPASSRSHGVVPKSHGGLQLATTPGWFYLRPRPTGPALRRNPCYASHSFVRSAMRVRASREDPRNEIRILGEYLAMLAKLIPRTARSAAVLSSPTIRSNCSPSQSNPSCIRQQAPWYVSLPAWWPKIEMDICTKICIFETSPPSAGKRSLTSQ
jgi:hypothetical protein